MRSDDDLLTTDELATVRRVASNRLRKERLAGNGPPFIRDGGLVRYRWGDYRAWLEGQRRYTSTSELVAA